jgi:hypothetical protein
MKKRCQISKTTSALLDYQGMNRSKSLNSLGFTQQVL